MKDLGIAVPPNIAAWGLGGILGLAGYALFSHYLKDKKMTKLEKAFMALLMALGEKIEALQKDNDDLYKRLGECVPKADVESLNTVITSKQREIDGLRLRNGELTERLEVLQRAEPASPRKRKRKPYERF